MNSDMPFEMSLSALVLSKQADDLLGETLGELGEGRGEVTSIIVAAILLGLSAALKDPDMARDVIDTIVPLPENAPEKMRFDLKDSAIVGARDDLLENAALFVGRWQKAKRLAKLLSTPGLNEYEAILREGGI
jgi:hypothetical protein